MKKKNVLNALMVLIVAVIAISGVMAVKSLKGPAVAQPDSAVSGNQQTEQTQSAQLVVTGKSGIVTVERKGIAYEVDENTAIRSGDIIRSKISSEITLSENGKAVITLGADTELKVTDADTLAVELAEGEIFVDRRNTAKPLAVTTDGAVFTPNGTTFTVTAYKSAYTAYVYSGSVTASGEKVAETVTADSGKTISAVSDANGNVSAKADYFTVNALSDWQIGKLQSCGMDDSFYITAEEIKTVVDNRAAEKAAAQQALITAENQAKAELAQEQQQYDENYQKYLDALASGAQTTTDADGNVVIEVPAKYATIEIRCDTILNNKANLKAGKEAYVPSNGVILATSKVYFEDGETVFEVLQRACQAAGLQLEYSWTPMYNSYYIEGINNLYEFDCGSESGWMYKVNGWFPNYGCSSYTLKDGDVIVWCYTCNGLGADVGGRVNY